MAATITVTCPECDTSVKALAEMEGKKVRCKSCGSVFVVRSGAPAAQGVAAKPGAKAAPKPAKPPPDDDDEDEESTPYGVTDEDLSFRCPHCANEMESRDAIICLHCGYNIVTREQARTKKIEDQTAADWLLWLLPGILCVLGIIGLATLAVMYCLYIDEWLDTETWYGATLAYGGIKLWNCILAAAIMWVMAKFAVRRLIFDRVPPEVERH
jgi:DNA-directed RNA polymerase subunit RPC12/RpoP